MKIKSKAKMKAAQMKICLTSKSPGALSAKVVEKTVKTIKTRRYSPAFEKFALFFSEKSLMGFTRF